MLARRALAIALVVTLGAGVWYLTRDSEPKPSERLETADRVFTSNDPLTRACDLDAATLVRIWRGHHPIHSEDITTVPQAPNYSGSFDVTSHSGPWDYVQNVPLVLYGPKYIKARGTIAEPAKITDVYATIGDLLGVELPERDGEVLDVSAGPPAPKLVVTVVWDGVGRNVLERHPDSWPNLKRMEKEGTSFLDATVGSSPSITPATHSSLGTGAFPKDHGITAIEYRATDGVVRSAFAGKNPSELGLTTFADEIDLALDNEPLVGMLAWKSWHMGMLSHGGLPPGGDADEMALIDPSGRLTGNDSLYTTPLHLSRLESRLAELAADLDAADGKRDGETLGHDVLEMHDNPAWVNYQGELLLEMLRSGSYGQDAVPDLFMTNFKVTDIASHQYSMDSEEEAVALEAQDAVLGDLIEYLDAEVGDYVVIVTADHGNTPAPERTGAWPILQGQLQADVDAYFKVPEGRSLIEQTTAVGPFLDTATMEELDVTTDDIAKFLNGYTIADNWKDDVLPEGYEDRGEEQIFAAAFPSDEIERVNECAFGQETPPKDIGA